MPSKKCQKLTNSEKDKKNQVYGVETIQYKGLISNVGRPSDILRCLLIRFGKDLMRFCGVICISYLRLWRN